MGLFSKNKSEAKSTMVWNQLNSIEQLNEIIVAAQEKPVVIFKHSTRCGISAMALESFKANWTSQDTLADVYILDLLNHRDVSNEIVVLTGVFHQSPQAIVLKGTEVVYEATHSGINARKIESILRKE
ncbi:MAG: bacillithiol system redox-active protein YtxJ [Crocinitomicaceae bacterium]|nr:bacillithiol system redox-active protein YtxJ [Crocinitomicaceae bacterium]